MKPRTISITTTSHARLRNRSGHPIPRRDREIDRPRERIRPGNRVLLVDDDPTVRDSLKDVLEAEGYQIIPAEDGQQALDLANKSPVDLVLLDLNMPVKNGWDTFEQFTREHPFIPVVIVTARSNQLFTALGAGAGALLEKPMDIRTLLRTIAKLLAETADQRLARLAGKQTTFHYQPAIGVHPESQKNF